MYTLVACKDIADLVCRRCSNRSIMTAIGEHMHASNVS